MLVEYPIVFSINLYPLPSFFLPLSFKPTSRTLASPSAYSKSQNKEKKITIKVYRSLTDPKRRPQENAKMYNPFVSLRGRGIFRSLNIHILLSSLHNVNISLLGVPSSFTSSFWRLALVSRVTVVSFSFVCFS
ncbi:hypothetical protein VTL71DRAFT_914 [Oculimacula yallundae]|uniref:Uncharacterized protein n=1 Tax=Oculimacula yallundae TaxID=86028 RepID=A0ABR4D1D1_9HELO